MSASDTPRTDALNALIRPYVDYRDFSIFDGLMQDFLNLERELAAAKAKIAELERDAETRIRMMKPCKLHEHLPFKTTAIAHEVLTYCPHCESLIPKPLSATTKQRAPPQSVLWRTDMSEWKTIESAPRDGTWVLIVGGIPSDDSSPRPAVAQWTNDLNGRKTEWHWQFAWYDGGYYGFYDDPTHWMELPEPPKD